ncbi:TPA: Gfo/Idh/MocA family oxidoreductase [Candidatus Poribacteria bacterium]|nr:Gfo/Idh/MocA family oxidoreductase [Candidatus Poribacteria bacterium]
MAKKINVGMIGYSFMGKAHTFGYKNVGIFYELEALPVMKVLCGRKEEGVSAAAERYGWESYETDWKKLVHRDDIDVVDICTPNNQHHEIVIGTAEAGKNIFCEKPLAKTLDEAKEMLQAVRKAGVKHMIGFNYRTVPAIVLAKRLIDDGKLGDIYHFRGVYLQDWIVDPSVPLSWRLDGEVAGSGPLGDLAAHTVDIARYLLGDITNVVANWKTIIEERPLQAETVKGTGIGDVQAAEETGKVTVEDAVMFLAKFANGALGTFEATRFATGRKNYNAFEVNGSKGSVRFCFEDMNRLEFYSREDDDYAQGWRNILATENVHEFAAAWWPPGHIIGYGETFVNEVYVLLDALAKGQMPTPDFVDGVKCQAILEAVVNSVKSNAWEVVETEF